MPASNQLITYNDLAAMVAANQAVWSGSAQSGTYIITWSQAMAAIVNDGSNPAGYASNQCPVYSDVLARALVLLPPTSVVATDAGGGECDGSWSAPSSGLSPTSYDYQFTGANSTGVINTTSLSMAHTGYTNGQLAHFQVRSKRGSLVSSWASSNTVTMLVGGG